MPDGNQITTIDHETAAPAMAGNDPMLAMLERVMTNPEMPMDRLSMMLDLRERQMAKEAEQEFNRAFADAMAEMPTVKKSGKNNHTHNTYATLDDLIHAARPTLSRHGLSLNWQVNKAEGGNISVTAYVRHSSGHFISTTDEGKADSGKAMNALQGGGSTQTYLKRYTGFAILGMASGDEIDDDGRGANKPQPISAEAYQHLLDEIDRSGADRDKVAAFLKVDNLAEIDEMQLGRVTSMLARKRADAEKAKAEAGAE